MKKVTYTLMIHGGTGTISNPEQYRKPILSVLKKGESMLKQGASALDVVEWCVSLLENNPIFNAGRGSVLNAKGEIEMDAAIMDGLTLRAGAVAGVKNIKNPIQLARLVMEKSEHVFLVGEGAIEFANLHNIRKEKDKYFITKRSLLYWKNTQKADKKMGTVGAVAFDVLGNLAAATSTGGIVNKRFGRVGDTPIIGSGVFADNETCAVSSTGYGEQFIRTVLAKDVADRIRYKHISAMEAAKESIEYLVRRVNGLGGVIVVDKDGSYGYHNSTRNLITGVAQSGKDIRLFI